MSELLASLQSGYQHAMQALVHLNNRAPGSLTTQALAVGGVAGMLVYILLNRRRRLPPGPRPLPVLGNLLWMRSEEEAFYVTLARWAQEKYGPVVTIYLGPMPCVTLNTIDVITEALVHKGADFAGRPFLHSMHVLTEGSKDILFASDSAAWKLQRKIAVQALRHYLRGHHLEKILHKAISLNVNKMLAEPGPFDPHPYNTAMIFRIINTICFGEEESLDDDATQYVMTLFDKFNEEFGNGVLEDVIPFLKYWPTQKFKNLTSSFREFLQHIHKNIERHRKTFSPDNIRDLTDSVLLAQSEAARKESSEIMALLTDTHVGQTVSDVFAGGWDTSRLTMDWILLFLAGHPEVQKRVQREVEAVTEGNSLPGLKDREHLQYTQAVLYETLRLGTVVPTLLPHSTVCDTSVGGYHLSKGTMVLVNAWAVLHDPDTWAEPEVFKPERFLDEHGKVKSKLDSWIPFSLGPRACLGESIAKPELLLLLAGLLKKVDITLPPGTEYSQDYLPTAGMAVHIPKPYKVVVTARQSAASMNDVTEQRHSTTAVNDVTEH